MSQEEDWYKAYETERLSLLNGGGKGSDKKNLSAADDLAAYYGAMQPESQGAPAAPVSPSIAKFEAVTPSPTTPPAPTSTAGGGNYGSFANEAEAVAFYAKGGGASSGTPELAYNEFAFPLDYEDQDNRFGVKFVQPPPEMSAIKVGRLVYYAHVVDMYFKGFFTSSKVSMGLVVTPKCVWLGDLKTGNFIICKEIADIRTMFVLGEHSIGLRTGHGADVFVKQVANRERFVAVLKRLYAATGKALNVITGGEDREKSYRGEIVYLDREQWQYSPVVEDPRTGLELVEVPPKHLEHYGVLAPKNLHWFGGCNQVSLIGNNKMTGTRRGSWITPTGIFLSIHTGPRPDGSQIVRCISIDTLRCVVDGPGFAVGLNIQSNPPQPDLIIDYDDLNTKRRVLFILEQCYLCRTNQTLITRKAQNFAGLRLADDRKFVPQLFRMSTRDELYGLLRGKP